MPRSSLGITGICGKRIRLVLVDTGGTDRVGAVFKTLRNSLEQEALRYIRLR